MTSWFNSSPTKFSIKISNSLSKQFEFFRDVAVGAATAKGCGAGRNVATFTKTMELIKAGELNEDNAFWRHGVR